MKRETVRDVVNATVAVTSLVFCIIIFYTMRNEHHETLSAIQTASADVRAYASDVRAATPPPFERGGTEIAAQRKQVACPTSGNRTMVLVASGQSNADNTAGVLTRSKHGARIVEFFRGHCYVAEDPLIGGTAWGGSPWVALGNSLLDAGMYDDVVIAVAVMGGSSIKEWKYGGAMNASLADLGFELTSFGLPVTHVMWVQGEGDRYPNSRYRDDKLYGEALTEVISTARKSAPHSKFYVTLASWCPLGRGESGPIESIRSGQRSVVSTADNIFQGPDLDLIANFGDRYDVCHLSAAGLQKFVAGWMDVLIGKQSEASH
jgi:hypothetical protein